MTDAVLDGGDTTVRADELPDGLVIADQAGRVVVFNQAAAALTGLEAGAALGKDFRDVLPLEDVEGRPWWSCTDPYQGLRTRRRQPERCLLLPDGRELQVTAGFVRDDGPGSDVVRLVILLRDNGTRERVERSRADLVSTVAHELRSPLTSVKGFTATLLAKWERFTDEQKRLMLETVNADADRVTRLITELLDISRIDSGRLEVKRQVVDLEAATTRLVTGLVTSGTPEGRVTVTAAEGLPETWADPDKIDQMLGNLVENALRHGDGQVSITIEPVDGGTAVTVADEGEGIPDEVSMRVFRKFWRSGRRGGSGLGLYIVKGLVEAHGGSITLGRGPTGGASFRFVLPPGVPDFAS
ncbi:MAG: ATP-binding protein [Micromonosporaceae bacterium]